MTPRRVRSASTLIGIAAAGAVMMSVVMAPAAAGDPAPAAGVLAADLEQGLVHRFALDETSGTTLANTGSAGSAANARLMNSGKATMTGAGIRFNPESYESALTGAYVELPSNLTAGFTSLSVDFDVWIDPANVGEHQIWSLGSKSGSCDVDTGGQGSIFASNTQRFRVAAGSVNVQQNRVRLTEGAWKHVTYTQSPNTGGTSWTGTVYIDGVQHAQATNLTTPPSVNTTFGTGCNYLARSQTSGNYSFRGTLRDFRIYDRVVDAAEITALAAPVNSAGVTEDAAAIDLGLTTAIVDDIVLPKLGSVAGSTITWASSDPSVVSVYTPPAVASARKVDVLGVITRPAQGQPDATATITATVRKGATDVTTREIPIVVKAQFDDARSVDRDTLDLELHATEAIRGNITLPAEGEFGSTITWSSDSELITSTGVVTRPAYGLPEVPATLTATITKGAATKTKTFDVTVTSKPRTEEYERYFLGYFKGEGIADGEQIMFATSNGNTALDWTGLTGGRPSLISQLGDQGLRDPHIVRSPDGDTFYMIATDLNWYDQGGYAINDTQYIEVFESNDLVNWTPQRHVKVAPDDAGNAFAPESLWVDEIGGYAVFWAQSLWNDPVNRTGQGNAQMWYNVTRDFQTFSEPKVWQNPAPQSRIDTTAIKVGDQYYRVTKNETGAASSDLFSEKHGDFLDSDINAWTRIASSLGKSTWQSTAGYEGPVIFKANPGDTACPGQFYLWGDRYTNGGGYQGACSADIEATAWNALPITMTNAGVARPRHGTVIPITLREWNHIRGIPTPDVATTTDLTVSDAEIEQGEVATATVEVTAADTFETGGEVQFSVGSWSKTVHLEDGEATVDLPSDLPLGNRTVTAEFLGFDILEGSQDTATIKVTAAAAIGAVTVSEVEADAATVSATVTAGDAAQQVWVEYSTRADGTGKVSTEAVAVPASAAPETVTFGLEGLAAKTTFHYRVVMQSESGSTITGSWAQFTTGAVPVVPDPTVSIAVSPASARVGDTVKVTWSSNADALVASGAWSGSKASSGTQNVTLTTAGTLTFTLTASGEGGSAAASATVTVRLKAASFAVSTQKGPQYAGKPIVVKASKLAPGEAYAVTISGIPVGTGKATSSGAVSKTVTIPTALRAEAKHTVVVTGSTTDRVGKTSVMVVGAKTLKPTVSKASVARGAAQKVSVKGLAAYEPVSISVLGKTYTGTASSSGTYSKTFTVAKSTAKGKKTVTVWGLSKSRTGKVSFTVK